MFFFIYSWLYCSAMNKKTINRTHLEWTALIGTLVGAFALIGMGYVDNATTLFAIIMAYTLGNRKGEQVHKQK